MQCDAFPDQGRDSDPGPGRRRTPLPGRSRQTWQSSSAMRKLQRRSGRQSSPTPDRPDATPPRLRGGHARFDVAIAGASGSLEAQDTVRRLRHDSRGDPRCRCPDRRVRGDQPRHPGRLAVTNRDVVIRRSCSSCCWFSSLCWRSLVAPLLLMATVVLSFGAALGASGWCSGTASGSAGPMSVIRCSRSFSWSRWGSTTTSS